jgi:hypothetical protein
MLNKFTLFLLLVGLTAFYACKDKLVDNPLTNKPPTTKIFLNPDSNKTVSQQPSNIHLYWSGDDPDGTVLGFYFKWDDDTSWTFTTKNDSLFLLQVGAVNRSFTVKVAAVDNSGNGIYDSDIIQNGIHYGAEPFTDFNGNGVRDANVGEPYTDLNGNGKYDPGEPYTDLNGNGKIDFSEPFIDIGLIDPNPATLTIPIKNTAPTIVWDALSTHPDISFSVMTFGWDVADIDGDMIHGVNTIQNINIALNDTTKFVSLNGTVSVITIRTSNFNSADPLMDIYINGIPTNLPINSQTGDTIRLPGLKFDANNIFYVQVVDISGAESAWISSAAQPNSNPGWFVKRPKGNVALVNNYSGFNPPSSFYTNIMDSLFSGKYDVIDLVNQKLPYINSTFLETVKLFKGILWYTDNNPSLDLAGATVQKITAANVKIFFSMLFPLPTTDDLNVIQGFLPIRSDSSSYISTLKTNVVVSDTSHTGYPTLKVSVPFNRVRGFFLNPSVTPIYYCPNKELAGFVGFENSSKNIFFLGLPLNSMDGIPGSVAQLLTKVFFQDFNITP